MSFVVKLHAYQDLGYRDGTVLSEAWYWIRASIAEDPAILENYFKEIARAFASEHGDELDPSVLGDFNWGDFIAEIPEEFLDEFGVEVMHGNVPQSCLVIFVEHDEHLLR